MSEENVFLKTNRYDLNIFLLGACLVLYNGRNLLQRTGVENEGVLLADRKCQRLEWKFSTVERFVCNIPV
jgi:hypothetical protein